MNKKLLIQTGSSNHLETLKEKQSHTNLVLGAGTFSVSKGSGFFPQIRHKYHRDSN